MGDYQTSGVSDFKLKLSYWYITHKLQLKRLLIILLIILNVIFFGYALVFGTMLLLFNERDFEPKLAQLAAGSINYSAFRQANAAKPISASFESVPAGQGRYDYVAVLRNENSNLIASRVTAQLLAGGEIVEEKTAFVFPGENKYLSFFFSEISPAQSPTLKIAHTEWVRDYDFTDFAAPRLNFFVSEVDYDPNPSGQFSGGLLTFKLANQTAFNYWQVGVHVVLLNGSRVVGANYLSVDQFRSGESRDLTLRFSNAVGGVTNVDIQAQVDITNPSVYMDAR